MPLVEDAEIASTFEYPNNFERREYQVCSNRHIEQFHALNLVPLNFSVDVWNKP